MSEFRGQRVDNGEWVYGDRFTSPHSVYIGKYTNTNEKGVWRGAVNIHQVMKMYLRYHKVIPKTVEQYIGIKDKNDKKLYGEDIIIWNKNKYVIMWNEKLLGWYMQPIQSYLERKIDIHKPFLVVNIMKRRAKFMEIIGNTHQNLELLETK